MATEVPPRAVLYLWRHVPERMGLRRWGRVLPSTRVPVRAGSRVMAGWCVFMAQSYIAPRKMQEQAHHIARDAFSCFTPHDIFDLVSV